MTWYYKDGNQEIGPVSKSELRQLVKECKISARTLVRSVNTQEWRPLIELVKGQNTPAIKEVSPPPVGPGAPPPGDNKPGRAAPDAPLPTPAHRIPFQFSGSGGEYFKIWIVNVVLTILTLGIYSAWAKVRRKQYFYGNTQINGASFQYLADPIKILKGRIIVFGGFMIYSLANQFYPTIGIVISLVFLPALPWFVIRALTFNTRNSAMRNIRFNFHGTYGQAARVFVLLPMLMPLTLGIIGPYLFYRQKKFMVDNSAYGTTRFNFEATAKDYYALVFKLLIPLAICIVTAVVAYLIFPPATELAFVLAFVVFYLYAMAYFAVKSSNLLFNSSKLSGHGFKATMAIKDFLIIVVTNTLATALTVGFFHPYAQVRAYRYKISQLALMSAGDLDRFVTAEKQQVSALGDEFTDFMDFDLGL